MQENSIILFKKKIINMYGGKGKIWLSELPKKVQQATEIWKLTNLRPVNNLSYNYVLEGLQEEKPIILKLIPEVMRLNKEVQALKSFAEHGAVPVLAYTDDALLLERIMPGYSLSSYLPDKKNEARKIICDIMRRLHQAPTPKNYLFPHIRDHLTELDKDVAIPREYLEKSRILKNQLLQTSEQPRLLHGDLHHGNILSQGTEWKVIDPHGIVGYPINETWAFIVDPLEDTQYVAEYLNFEVNILRQWYFVHIILSACWNVGDNLDPTFFLEIAAKTYPLVQEL